MEAISSRHNPIVKTFRALARGSDDTLLLEGLTLVQEALNAGVQVRAVAFSSRLLAEPDAGTSRLLDALAKTDARLLSVSPAVMGAISPVRTPSGVVGIASRASVPLERVYAGAPPLVLILAGLQDPGNVGAVIRAADAAGATGIVACERTADPFGWKALRGAMGSTFRLPVAAEHPAGLAVATARLHGLRVLAATPRDGRPMHGVDLTGPTAILLGAEGAGLGREMEQLADDRISIPMRAPVESLNVAVSAALVVYEAYRQRHGR
jgi:TrmH family RNA methyltransferase